MGRRKIMFVTTVLLMCILMTNAFDSFKTFASSRSTVECNDADRECIFVEDNYRVIFKVTSEWNTGYNVNISIINLGQYEIGNWKLIFDYDGQIENIWNAYWTEHGEKEYLFSNRGFNQKIGSQERVEFGFSCKGEFKSFPTTCKLFDSLSEVAIDDCSVTYLVENEWNDGFTAKIIIQNNCEKTIEDWKLSFYYNRTISNIWNAEIAECRDNYYKIKNAGYNANIKPGDSIVVGFNGTDGLSDDIIIDYVLSGSCIPENEEIVNEDIYINDDIFASETDLDVALCNLDIIYFGNDTDICVTNNIELVNEVNGFPVRWESSDSRIVDSMGRVVRPHDESVIVVMSAYVEDDKEIRSKDFVAFR